MPTSIPPPQDLSDTSATPRRRAAYGQQRVLELRASVMTAIAARIQALLDAEDGPTQAELAGALGITRSRLNRLLKHDVDLFGLDSLAAIAARAGLTVRVSVARPYRKA
jgi:predicted XRE-type DNA-binding protein